MPYVPVIWLFMAFAVGILLGIGVERYRNENLRALRRTRRLLKRSKNQYVETEQSYVLWSSSDGWETRQEVARGTLDAMISRYGEAYKRGNPPEVELSILGEGEIPKRELCGIISRIDE